MRQKLFEENKSRNLYFIEFCSEFPLVVVVKRGHGLVCKKRPNTETFLLLEVLAAYLNSKEDLL